MRMRFVLLAVALFGVVLTASSCGVLGEAERSVPPWEQQYSDEEWLAMVTQCEHQPRIRWKGTTHARIAEHSWGVSLDGLMFYQTPAHLVEHQVDDGLLSRSPRLLLPLFESEDPSVVLTGIYAYRRGYNFFCRREYYRHAEPSDLGQEYGPVPCWRREDAVLIKAAMQKALDHTDTRVRCGVIETLCRMRWLGVDEVRRGLADDAVIVRNLTASFLGVVVENEQAGGAVLRGVGEPAWAVQQRLAPVLLDHLNDDYFYVRAQCATTFTTMFPWSNRPPKFDWAKADWQSRVDMQAEWKAWWEGHGRGALVAAAR